MPWGGAPGRTSVVWLQGLDRVGASCADLRFSDDGVTAAAPWYLANL